MRGQLRRFRQQARNADKDHTTARWHASQPAVVARQRYERASVLVTSNLPFDEWAEIFGSERLTGALLDRLTHHVHILEMNGDSYRLKQSRRKRNPPSER